jgi:hypothetical protein
MRKHDGTSARLRLAILAALLVLTPLLLVHLIPTDTIEPFVFRATVIEHLGQSTSGQLQYYRVDVLDGFAPAPVTAIALDSSYSRGFSAGEVQPGFDAWFQGSLMTPEVFYGEQYLFFGLPQVYVRQAKSGLLWPDQWSSLKVLYLSPLETLAAPLQIPFLVRSDSFTWGLLTVLLARCVLIATISVLVVRRRLRGTALAAALLAYSLAAILLTMPILGDLY